MNKHISKPVVELRRTIGLPSLLFFGLGNILGAGIYVLIGKIAGEAGMYTPVAFLVASVVAGQCTINQLVYIITGTICYGFQYILLRD